MRHAGRDSEPLAVISIGVPVGLGICWAWVHSDWSARTKTAGFLAAAAGALVGAWLGFHATADLLAVVTATVGATVGANLSLLVLDIARERQVHDRVAATTAKETLAARPATS